MQFRQAILVADQQQYLLTPGKSNSFESLFADFQSTPVYAESETLPGLSEATQYTIFLHPKQDITLQRLEIQFDMPLAAAALFFANGYQSQSESKWMPLNGRIPRRWFASNSGDNHIADIPRGAGHLHSWTYTVLKDGSSELTFAGSLNESTGFTLFLYDQPRGLLTVRKDLDQLQLAHSFPALDFVLLRASEKTAYDAYFQLLALPPRPALPVIGWGSGTQALSEAALLKNVDSFSALYQSATVANAVKPTPCFLIGAGWQGALGDWLNASAAFPGGMGAAATKIREKDLLAGIWLAPFIASAESQLVQKHSDYLLKDAKNKPIHVGKNKRWGGSYYALDFYKPAVQAYLAGVFHLLLEKWGYQLLQLDALYAVCLAPPPGKTRGQVMSEAMEFLRRLAGNTPVLASGVPLGACFGNTEYGVVAADSGSKWEDRFSTFLGQRERPEALASLRSTLARWPLHGRAFRNVGGAFTLQKQHPALRPVQQQTLLTIQALLGGFLHTSDALADYSAEQEVEWQEALSWQGAEVQAVTEIENDLYRIDFQQDSQQYAAFCNLLGTARSVTLAGNERFEIQAYESMVLKVREL